MTEHPGQWGPQGGYPPQGPGGYPPQQPGGYPPQQPAGYPPQPGYPPQQPGAGGLSAAEGLCTPAASWWISASAARGLWASGPSGWRSLVPRADQPRRAR